MSDAFPPPQPVLATPLVSLDPPRIGQWWLDARLAATPSGVAYAAHDEDGTSAMLVVLASGAAADAAARDRLAGEVNRMHLDTVLARGGQGQDEGRMAHRHVADDDAPTTPDARPQAPWVALAYDGSPAAVAEAHRLLAAIDLSRTPLVGRPTGPDYQMYWRNEVGPGTQRLWPLPWPGRHDRAGWTSTLVAYLLAIVLSALVLLLAVLAFQNTPPAPQQPPITPPPSSASGGGTPSGSPSESSSGGSPSQSNSQSMSQSASPSDGSSGSQGGKPSPDRRLVLDQGNRERP